MGSVNIVVDIPDGHLASIYALMMSIITNKYEESIYHIYLSIHEETTFQLKAMLALQTDTISMIFVSKETQLSGIGDKVQLLWNMLVTGDLTEIAEQDLIDNGNQLYSNNTIDNNSIILPYDTGFNPEEYFDHPLAGQWLKYYKISPMSHVPLRRCSYIETLGEISVKNSESAVPIAITTCDWDIPGTVALLNSIRRNTSTYTQLDIRVFYRNISQKHADILLSFRDENTSVVLFNTKGCTNAENPNTFIIPALLAFDEYDTVIYMDSKCLCLDNVSPLYRSGSVNNYDVRVIGTFPETGEMPKMMLLNTFSWIQNGIYSRYFGLRREYESFIEFMYKAGVKQIDCIKSFAMRSFLEEDNPWLYPDKTTVQLLWNYLFMSPYFEQLKSEALSYDQQREVAEMQELLQKLKDMEIENNRLVQEVHNLEEENTSLRVERDRFLYELSETRKSVTYRIGRAITFLPRRMRGERKSAE